MHDTSLKKSRPFHITALLLIAASLFLAYSNAFHGEFVFDDHSHITIPAYVKITDLSPQSLYKAATGDRSPNRWLPKLTFALNYYFGGLDVRGYHLVNIIIHVVNAGLLYALTIATLNMPALREKRHKQAIPVALATALLWALHPVQTNAVTYITQRMTSLAALFFLASLLFYIVARTRAASGAGRVLFYSACVISGLMAMVSKESSVVLPAVIFGYEYFFIAAPGKINIKKTSALLAGFAVFLVGAGWFYYGQDPFSALLEKYDPWYFTLTERLLTETRVLFFYISLLLLPLPSRLNLDHDFRLSTGLLTPPQTLLSIIALVGLVWLCVLLFRRHRLLSFAIFWYLINLVIESSVIPLALVYEYRLYLPSTFVVLAAVACLYQQFGQREKLLTGGLVVTALALMLFTWQRNKVWETEVSLWRDVVKKSPQRAKGYVHLGNSLYRQSGNETLEEQEKLYLKALELDPNVVNGFAELGLIYRRHKRLAEAVSVLRQAKARPNNDPSYVHNAMALIYKDMHNYKEALNEARMAILYKPDQWEAYETIGIIYEEMGQHQEALAMLTIALKNGPENASICNNMGKTSFSLGLTDDAISYFEKAISADPGHAESHYNLGIAYHQKGFPQKAREEIKKGMDLMNR